MVENEIDVPAAEAASHKAGERPVGEKASQVGPGANVDLHEDPDDPGEAPPATEDARPWRVARCLLALRVQVNEIAPGRDTASDGTIGDASHQSRASDHNPWVTDHGMGVVTAMDITHSPQTGCDAGVLAVALRDSRDKRLKYIIWNRQIANASPVGGAAAWAWRPYTGTNPHDHHVHVSVVPVEAEFDDTGAWALPNSLRTPVA